MSEVSILGRARSVRETVVAIALQRPSNKRMEQTAPLGAARRRLVRHLVLADARTGAAAHPQCSTDLRAE